MDTLDYHEAAIDAGVKHRGFSFNAEYYFRTLDSFFATVHYRFRRSTITASWRERAAIVPKTVDLFSSVTTCGTSSGDPARRGGV